MCCWNSFDLLDRVFEPKVSSVYLSAEILIAISQGSRNFTKEDLLTL